jgi:DNA-binding transcriptional LysR family regulator
MELRHLRYFIAVAETRHMTRAAERLGIQQPPLSQQIKALEAELGCELFLRHPKGVELTAGGRAFLPEARAILARLEAAAAKAVLAAQGLEGSIAVGITSSAATHPIVPRLIRTYRETYPKVNLILSDGSAADLSDEMEQGRLDAAFLRAPVTQSPKIAYHPLLTEEMLLIVPAGHALVRNRTTDAMPQIPLKAVAAEPLILVRRPGAPGMYSNLLEACRRAGFSPRIAAEVERMLSAISFVAAGLGVSAVPASMRGILSDQVVYCRMLGIDPALSAPLSLAYRVDEVSPTAANLLRIATAGDLDPQPTGVR